MKEFKIKSISAEIKDINESQRIIEGYLSVFGNVDSYDEIVEKGAFTKTIKENGPKGTGRIRHFMDHNIFKAVGVFEELKEDERGLFFRSKLGRHTLGNDLMYMYMDGLVKEHSIGYDVVRDEKQGDTKVLTELKLWEGSSLQSWAANDQALVTDVKWADSFEKIEQIEQILRNSKMTDETIKNIELQLKVIRETLTPPKAPEPTTEDYSEIYQSLKIKL